MHVWPQDGGDQVGFGLPVPIEWARSSYCTGTGLIEALGFDAIGVATQLVIALKILTLRKFSRSTCMAGQRAG